jgi:hypothetical protein
MSIISDRAKLTCHADVAVEQGVRWFGGLTYDFWAENAERNLLPQTKAIESMVLMPVDRWFQICEPRTKLEEKRL